VAPIDQHLLALGEPVRRKRRRTAALNKDKKSKMSLRSERRRTGSKIRTRWTRLF
jgi:hypothetical protein